MSEVWKGFYALEGIDGSGKSTAIRQLKELCKKKGKGAVSFTSEPTSAGRKMLSALRYRSAPREPHVDSLSCLFAADRNEHLYGNGEIRDRLSQGVKVVCGRYLFSSLVYQGIAGGGEMAERLNANFPLPEILFLFDISAEEAVKRIAARGGETRAFERLDFLQKAEAEYRRLKMRLEMEGSGSASFKPRGMRIAGIDARLPREEIAGTIWSGIWKWATIPFFWTVGTLGGDGIWKSGKPRASARSCGKSASTGKRARATWQGGWASPRPFFP